MLVKTKICYSVLIFIAFIDLSCNSRRELSIMLYTKKVYTLHENKNIKIKITNNFNHDIKFINSIYPISSNSRVFVKDGDEKKLEGTIPELNKKGDIYSIGDMLFVEINYLEGSRNPKMIFANYSEGNWIFLKPNQSISLEFDLANNLEDTGKYEVRVFFNQNNFKNSIKKMASNYNLIEVK